MSHGCISRLAKHHDPWLNAEKHIPFPLLGHTFAEVTRRLSIILDEH